ncbi:hypothetical protein [Pedobacter frigoris]|uniref:hypothetical protein n=1 Tax=Pedobacter frigoris TaxID=2571272 RepID=UPI00292D1BF2|nr:hypothetical protein [Pedobacter frigoris]
MKNDSVQPENSVFFQQLDVCCQKVAMKVGKKNITEWKNSDYIALSGMLYRQTKVNLSENTLKRIFGKLKTSTRYYPQKATRDALAQFIGFRDWYEFELMHPVSSLKQEPESEHKIISDEPEAVSAAVSNQKKPIFKLTIALALFIGIGFSIYYNYVYTSIFSEVELVCLNPNGINPHSALFRLDAKNKLGDKPSAFSIDFGDGRKRKRFVSEDLINHYYEMPGRYYPVLYYGDNKIMDTTSVYLQTQGWTATASVPKDTTRVYPIEKDVFEQNNTYAVTPIEVRSAGVDTSSTFFIYFANVKPTEISGDNFELNADVKTSHNRQGVRCSQLDLVIYGEFDRHFLAIIKPECVAWSSYGFSENQKDGGTSDLRDLGHNLSGGANLKLRVVNKKASLYIDNKLVFHTSYNKPIGKVMGVKIIFSGIGEFKNFRLKDLKTGRKL